ncbi:MAG: hypothetical protein LIP23_09505 [Planctomycetes bacterium]|nr:hypothetical protein [Planctomycetota bacterium]
MADGGDGNGALLDRRSRQEADPESESCEYSTLRQMGPSLVNKAGAFAFLTLLAVFAAGLHFYMAGRGSGSYPAQLEAELLAQTELSLETADQDRGLTIVPTWPVQLYQALRRDIAFYSLCVVLAALLWGLAVQARGRRAAYLVQMRLERELDALRGRVQRLESPDSETIIPDGADTKG